MSLKQEISYWLRCDGTDQTGPCHSSVGPSRDLERLQQRARCYDWQLMQKDPATPGPFGEYAHCPRHKAEVKTP